MSTNKKITQVTLFQINNLTFNAVVAPVTLRTAALPPNYPNTICTVSGWGTLFSVCMHVKNGVYLTQNQKSTSKQNTFASRCAKSTSFVKTFILLKTRIQFAPSRKCFRGHTDSNTISNDTQQYNYANFAIFYCCLLIVSTYQWL